MAKKFCDIIGKSKDKRTYKVDTDKLVLPGSFTGVEIEVENKRFTNNTTNFWHLKPDGSLRNGGVELVSDPLFGLDLITGLEEVEKFIYDSNTGVPDFSERTGLHVHCDVRDLEDLDTFIRFVILNIIFERTLFKYCGKDRENSNYCIPMWKAESTISIISDIVRRKDDGLTRAALSAYSKYAALNLGASTRLGTVEYRHHAGTGKAEEILRWINIIQCIKKYAIDDKTPYTEILATISGMGARYLFDAVFGAFGKYLEFSEKDIFSGMRLAQDVIFALELDKSTKKHIVPTSKISNRFKALAKEHKISLSTPNRDDEEHIRHIRIGDWQVDNGDEVRRINDILARMANR